MFGIVNGYEDIDRNMFFIKLKESSTTRGHKAALVKEAKAATAQVWRSSDRGSPAYNINSYCIFHAINFSSP